MDEQPIQYTRLIGNTEEYPYLVGVYPGGNLLSSGMVVDPGLVLTCTHVSDIEDVQELEENESVDVITPHGRLRAQVRVADCITDLALLELAQSVPFHEPHFTDFRPTSAAALKAVGVQEAPGKADHLKVAEIELKYANTNDADGEILDIQFHGGARPGYSGGPVVGSKGGIVGLTRCGGPWAYSSNAIGLARIRAFLKEHMPSSRTVETTQFSPAGLKDSDIRQLETAAKRGDPQAQYHLALVYADPNYPLHQPEAAARWFRCAADQNHMDSAFRLAVACRKGEGVLRSEPEALRWFSKAARLGHATARRIWGLMLLDGRAGEKDPGEAARMFELAARQGDLEARYQLALLQLEGGPGIPRDEYKAMEGFRQVAQTGRSDAQYQLACMLANGYGAPADVMEALRWAEAAAAQHHEAAQDLVRELSAVK